MAQATRKLKIAILGFGREGQSILRFIQNRGLSRIFAPIYENKKIGKNQLGRHKSALQEIWVLDRNKVKVPGGVKAQCGKNYLKNLRRFDIIFRSPGVPYNLRELIKARSAGVKFLSATKLFFEHCPAKNIVGVTGTKGKGTTATLLYEIMLGAGKNVHLAGNIGKPALDILPDVKSGDYVVLELSSFQLQDLKNSPKYAVVLDIFPDHQDSHLNLREYYEAKAAIARHQQNGDKIFYFADNPKSAAIAKKSGGKKIAVSPAKFKLFGPKDLKLPGGHNFRNAVMAVTAARELGAPAAWAAEAAKNFRGLEHRLEFAGNVAGVAFYNDSASTNPQTAAAAIAAFPRQSKILIAGGQDKGLDYKPLARALKRSNTALIILFGENKQKIQKQIANSKKEIIACDTLEEAVRLAKERARIGSVVVFSPGAASFDMFQNYADRGEKFKKILESLR